MVNLSIKSHGFSTEGLNLIIGFMLGVPILACFALIGLLIFETKEEPQYGVIKKATAFAAVQPTSFNNLRSTDLFFKPVELPWPYQQQVEEALAASPLFAGYAGAHLVIEVGTPAHSFFLKPHMLNVAMLEAPVSVKSVKARITPVNTEEAKEIEEVVGSITPPKSPSREFEDDVSYETAALPSILEGKVEVTPDLLLRLNGRAIKLAGLKIPEKGKSCLVLSGERQECLAAAKDQLETFLKWRSVSCEPRDKGAFCKVGETDIADWMIRRGWAVPDGANANKYRAALTFAQNYKLGIWR